MAPPVLASPGRLGRLAVKVAKEVGGNVGIRGRLLRMPAKSSPSPSIQRRGDAIAIPDRWQEGAIVAKDFGSFRKAERSESSAVRLVPVKH